MKLSKLPYQVLLEMVITVASQTGVSYSTTAPKDKEKMQYTTLYHPQAEAALSSLNTEERNRILASVRKLAEFGLSDPDIAPLRERVDKEPAYVLRSDTDFRVVFTASQDRITVLDVLNKYFAERYA